MGIEWNKTATINITIGVGVAFIAIFGIFFRHRYINKIDKIFYL